MNQTPLFDAVNEYNARKTTRLHMPGHKGNSMFPMLCDIVALDVTEIPPTDDLYKAEGAIKAAEDLAAELYGSSATLFSAGGSTLCIQTMLRLAFPEGGKLILCRNCHKSAVNACALLDITPVWIYNTIGGDSLYPRMRADTVERAVKNNPDARAVFITSPDYYGNISEIEEIAEVCHRYGMLLIVDNAHGAHLIAFDGLHPNEQGADLVCDSAHKTLSCLTGGAFLHINNRCFTYSEAKEAMSVFGSSSPSYPIMISMDIARNMLENGKESFKRLARELEKIAERMHTLDIKRVGNDPCKLTLDMLRAKLNGNELSEILMKSDVFPEYADERYVVLMPSPENKISELKYVADIIYEAETSSDGCPRDKLAPEPVCVNEVFTPRQAFFMPCEIIPTDEAEGRVCQKAVAVCPPAYCIAVPGERITREHLAILKAYGIDKLNVIK